MTDPDYSPGQVVENGRTICGSPVCDLPAAVRGYCTGHYQRSRRGADINTPVRYTPPKPPKPERTCTVADCDRKVSRRDYCDQHYRRFRKYGEPTAGYIRKCSSPEEAIRTYVQQVGDCIEWTGYRDPNGYGHIMAMRPETDKKTSWLTHRYAWTLANGPIPDGIELDHECHNPACLNLDHLRLATRKQNAENRSGAQANSTSGVRGVHWDSRRKAWRARVKHSGKTYCVGQFSTIEEAERAVIELRNSLFTHNILDRKDAA